MKVITTILVIAILALAILPALQVQQAQEEAGCFPRWAKCRPCDWQTDKNCKYRPGRLHPVPAPVLPIFRFSKSS